MPSRRVVVRVVSALAVLVSVAATTTPASAATATTKARNDKVTVVASGTAKSVKVLANDRLAGTRSRTKVKIVKKPAALKARVTASKRIKVRATSKAKPGRYVLTYSVTSKKRTARAKLVVTVVRRSTPSTSAPRPTSTPKPSATPTPSSAPTPTGTPVPPLPGGATTSTPLLDAISQLSVTDEVTSGYDRDAWRHWNAGANPSDGCDTRSEVLLAEAVVTVSAGTSCPLTSSNSGGGAWYSYYDGATTSSPSTFDIDHLVPLAEAHRSGGHAWSSATKEAYANDLDDPRSLVAVSASSNRSKSDGDPAEWLPALERCRYVTEWVAVKTRWELSIDVTEWLALTDVAIDECSDTTVVVVAPAPVPDDTEPSDPAPTSTAPTSPATPTPSPAPTSVPTGTPTAIPTPGVTDPRFSTCKEATRYGYGPYWRGIHPEYDWYRDADKDGVVCE